MNKALGEIYHQEKPLVRLSKNKGFDKSKFDDAVKFVYDNKGISPEDLKKKEPRELIEEINRDLERSIKEGVSKTKLKYKVSERVTTALQDNVFVFSGMKTFHELKEASQLLVTDTGEIKPFYKFKEDVERIHEEYNERYLDAEHQYAVHSVQSAVRWNDYEEDGEDEYDIQIRTARDDKVRPEHAAMDGVTVAMNDAFCNAYIPPFDWGCRCTFIRVLKGRYAVTDSREAIKLGETATTRIGKDGTNKLAMFRYNPGKTLTVFPEKHPYFARKNSPEEVKKAQDVVKDITEKKVEKWSEVPTDKGSVRVSSLHGKIEKKVNVGIASTLANQYGYDIELIARSHNKKTADSFNKTLGFSQEYKTNITPTRSAIDREIRDAARQADNIVLEILSEIDNDELERAIKGRVSRTQNVNTITIIRNGECRIVTREEILSNKFSI